jgi:RNA polymerase sigma-70 factor (ECF subfamily)
MSTTIEKSASTILASFDRSFRVRLKDHNPEAMTDFFDKTFDTIFAKVHRLIRSRQIAEDLTQDIFLKIHKGLPSLDVEQNLMPWVVTILNNRLRDYWRSQASRRNQTGLDEFRDSLSAPATEISASLEQSETEASVRRAIYRLPITMRSVLLLRTYDELSFVQIARVLRLTPGAARKRYSRALNELRGILPKKSSLSFAASLGL